MDEFEEALIEAMMAPLSEVPEIPDHWICGTAMTAILQMREEHFNNHSGEVTAG